MLSIRIGRASETSRARAAIESQSRWAMPPQPASAGGAARAIRPRRIPRPEISITAPVWAGTKQLAGGARLHHRAPERKREECVSVQTRYRLWTATPQRDG